MIEKLAIRITDYLAEKGIIDQDPEKKEIYQYGLDLMIQSVWVSVLTLLLGLLYGNLLIALINMVCFLPLRSAGGGWHAKTHWGCALTQGLSFTALFFLSTHCSGLLSLPIVAALFAPMLLLAILWAPVDHPNNPIPAQRRPVLKWRCAALFVLFGVASCVLILVELPVYASAAALSCVSATMSLIGAKIQYRKGEKEEA